MIPNSIQASMGFSAIQQPGDGPENALLSAAEEFMETLRAGEEQGALAMTGSGDPHQLVLALAESKLAIEATTAIRDRVVEAYQELLRMPV